MPTIFGVKTIGDNRNEHGPASDTGLQGVAMPAVFGNSGRGSHLTGVGQWIEANVLNVTHLRELGRTPTVDVRDGIVRIYGGALKGSPRQLKATARICGGTQASRVG